MSETGVSTREEIIKIARGVLPRGKYHDLKSFDEEEGAQRICLTANRGIPPHTQEVFIKIDKEPVGEAASRLKEGGYTTHQEVKTLLEIPVDEAIHNHLSPVVDFYMSASTGSTISVEPRFKGAKSLKRRVAEQGPLDTKEFEDFMRQYVQANVYLIKNRRMVHRDQHPKNILIGPSINGKGLEARLTDMTTATTLDSIDQSSSTTWGARSIRHFAYGNSSFEKRIGAEQAEIYSIGMNAIFSLTGMFPVYYDNLNGTGISAFTGENLLNKDGTVNIEKHNEAIEQALSKFPKKARKHTGWIKKCVNGDVDKQYRSIDSLVRDFERTVTPTLIDRMRSIPKKVKAGLAAGLAALTIGGGALTYEIIEKNKEHSVQLAEASRYKITAEWNGLNPQIRNNLFEMKASLYGKDYSKGYPRNKFLRVERGQELSGHIECKEYPRQQNSRLGDFYSYSGQAYIEGYPLEEGISDTFGVTPIPSNEAGAYAEGAYFGGDFRIKIPKDLRDGVYSLAIATYAPTEEVIAKKESENRRTATSVNIKFTAPGKALTLKTIPLIVGDPKPALAQHEFNINSFDDNISLDEVQGRDEFGGGLSPRSSYFASTSLVNDEKISILGRGINRSTLGIKLPEGTNYLEGVAEVGVYSLESKQIIFYTAFPIRRTEYPSQLQSPLYFWGLGLPGKDFPEKLIEHRQNLEIKAAEAFARTNYSLPKE
ncbi:MAG: serine/threonine-protein kinase [Nanoarchaeota archaeon]|nr:serine/threonine-protein kinase [Nanoarchaeota archaeon]